MLQKCKHIVRKCISSQEKATLIQTAQRHRKINNQLIKHERENHGNRTPKDNILFRKFLENLGKQNY